MSLLFVSLASGATLSLLPKALAEKGVSETWAARYNSYLGGDDRAIALAIDAWDNVVVTGAIGGWEGYGTIKYDSDGHQLWIRYYQGPHGGYGSDYPAGVAVDGAGNVYVTGHSDGNGTKADYATIKYDSDGTELWVARYDGPPSSYDAAHAITVDELGNVYVTGHSDGTGDTSRKDIVTVKYDSKGNELWIARYDVAVGRADFKCSLDIDNEGNVYVTGAGYGGVTDSDYATMKYDADGNEVWVARYDGPVNWGDWPCDIEVDDEGSVYVTGSSIGRGTSWDYATVKYDTHGNQLWVARYANPMGDWDEAHDLALDHQGNVYVIGESRDRGIDEDDKLRYDFATIKYDADGNCLWVARYDGPEHRHDGAVALTVDSSGNAYVSGWSFGNTGYDWVTVRYDSDGNQAWAIRHDGPRGWHDSPTDIAIDDSGNVYVTGSTTSGTGYDYTTIKYVQTDILTPSATSTATSTPTQCPPVHTPAPILTSFPTPTATRIPTQTPMPTLWPEPPPPPAPPPCRFWGSVEVNDVDAPKGTTILAMIEGDTYSTTTTAADQPGSESIYALIVGASGLDYAEGTEVIFIVDGHVAEQTGIWKVGSNIELNLSAISKPAPLNIWVIIGPVLGLAAIGGAAYYLLRGRRQTSTSFSP